jgi:hypothetical protein
MTPHTPVPAGWEGRCSAIAPGMDTADDDFVESSQAEGRPVRSKQGIARYKASSQGPR